MSAPVTISNATLHELHRIHRQLGDLRERQERGPKQVKVRQLNVLQSEEKLAKAQAEQKAARIAIDQKQLTLKTNESRVNDLQAKLNAANSNREYQAFKDQIAADKMAKSVLEDEILEAMEKLNEFKTSVTVAEDQLKKSKDELQKSQLAVKEQEQLVQADIQRLEGQLHEVESALDADFLTVYRRIVAAKGEDAMAQVEGEFCGGCNQQLTANTISELRLARAIFCKHCGRLIYLPSDRMPSRA
ncbi:MAG TPA: phospholipase [Pirellulales bacterium]|jgi:hypothetical protein|nr:phospholipase [Pirellulales bacterium]